MRAYVFAFCFCSFLLFRLDVSASEKACPECDFLIIEKAENTGDCITYHKYFFEGKKIGKAYEALGAYFAPNHKYGEFWKRYLPETREKYIVNKELTDNVTVMMVYDIIPKTKHVREGKKANIEMIADKENHYFELRETENGVEISYCYSIK
ncbi:MAG: hypothetical protein K2N67_01945 [Mucispirillum sp.]|nr:hypothetical protein [Mucispirillum sp.]